MRSSTLGFAGLIVACFGGVACSATDSADDVVVPDVDFGKSSSGPVQGIGESKMEQLGEFRGHWDGKQMTFTSLSGGKVSPRAFIQLPDELMPFETEQSLAVSSTCTQNHGPDYFAGPDPVEMANGGACTDEHLCALVTLRNDTKRELDRVFVQITNITPGFEADGDTVASVPPGYPLDNSRGLFDYGTLMAEGGGAQVQWNFPLANCGDFTFEMKVMGTIRRTNYVASRTTLSNQSEWIDACALPGMTRILENAGPGESVSDLPMPFPFTLYDLTFDSDQFPILSISSNGALGFSPISTDNVALPDLSGNSDYTIFPFWDNLQLGAAGVCYGSTGEAPNRKFVVTWTNANIVSTAAAENLTFSAVLNETSDQIQFYYNRYSNTQTNCAATSAPNRGGGATIGVQGPGIGTQYSYNSGTALQIHATTCPGNLEKVTLSALPGNVF